MCEQCISRVSVQQQGSWHPILKDACGCFAASWHIPLKTDVCPVSSNLNSRNWFRWHARLLLSYVQFTHQSGTVHVFSRVIIVSRTLCFSHTSVLKYNSIRKIRRWYCLLQRLLF
jgi:hypothetical protein